VLLRNFVFGSVTYQEAFYLQNHTLPEPPIEHMYVGHRLVMAYMGVVEGIYRGIECDTPNGDTAVAHIRGGDIFGKKPHSMYGQPPLHYYLESTSKLPQSVKRVMILSEDRGNPVYGALEKWGIIAELAFRQ
jgi:hypothetical protein